MPEDWRSVGNQLNVKKFVNWFAASAIQSNGVMNARPPGEEFRRRTRLAEDGCRHRHREADARSDLGVRPHRDDDPMDFVLAAAPLHQEPERFLKIDVGERADGQGKQAADDHQRRPPVMGNEQRGDPARNDEAGGNAEVDDDDERTAGSLRRDFRGERDDVGDEAAETDPRDEAQHDEFIERGRGRRDQTEQADDAQCGEDRGAPAEPVTDEAERRRPEEEAEDAGGQGGNGGRRRDVPGLDEFGDDVAHGGDVEPVRDHCRRGDDEEEDRRSSDALAVDEGADVDGRRGVGGMLTHR